MGNCLGVEIFHVYVAILIKLLSRLPHSEAEMGEVYQKFTGLRVYQRWNVFNPNESSKSLFESS
jgi:hypothetical protein